MKSEVDRASGRVICGSNIQCCLFYRVKNISSVFRKACLRWLCNEYISTRSEAVSVGSEYTYQLHCSALVLCVRREFMARI
jgi:hypothetical protein